MAAVGCSGVLMDRHGPLRFSDDFQHPLEVGDRFRAKEYVTTNIAHLRRNVIDDHHLALMAHGVKNAAVFVAPGAAL